MLALLVTLPLALLPRHPIIVLAVSSASLVAYDAIGYPASPADMAGIAVLVWVVAYSGAAVAWLGTALVTVAMVAAAFIRPGGHQPAALLADSVVVPAAAAVGLMVRTRRRQADLARREQALEAERLSVRAEHAASAERLRIAGELHDAIGHGLTLTALRAQAAACLFEGEPRRSRELLAEVARAGQSALEELHLFLRVLSDDSEQVETTARPDVEQVVRRFSEPGMDIDLKISGCSRDLEDALESTVAAIVAEGLSNIARHAQAARGTVRLSFQEANLVVEVADYGPGPAETTSAGFGLRGVRERVAAAGGQLAFGPGPQGGALLKAILPYRSKLSR